MNRWFLLVLLLGLVPAAPARAQRAWVFHPEPDLVGERGFAYAVDGIHRYAYRFGGRINTALSSELKRQALDDPDLTWNLVPVLSGPPERWHSRLFHDIRRNRLLLLGGYDADTTGHADVWAFDLATSSWSQLQTGPGGPAMIHNGFPMTYDTRHDQLLYLDAEATAGHAKVWRLDLVTLEWSSLEPETNFNLSANPFAPYRVCSAAAYDSLGDRVFLQLANSVLYSLDMSDPGAFVAWPGSMCTDPCPRLAVDEVGHRLILDMKDVYGVPALQSRTLSNLYNVTSWNADYQPDVLKLLDWAIDPVAGTIEVPVQTDRDTRSTLDLTVPRWSFRARAGRLHASDGMAGALDPATRAIYVYGGNIQVYKNDRDGTGRCR
jgi:hypothetical protein